MSTVDHLGSKGLSKLKKAIKTGILFPMYTSWLGKILQVDRVLGGDRLGSWSAPISSLVYIEIFVIDYKSFISS